MIELSVIIPTYNKREILKRCLEALNKQTTRSSKFEVIVVDDGSSDGTAREIRRLIPKFKYSLSVFSQKNQGPAAARNKGIKKAKGKIVLIINDDTIAAPDLIRQHLQFHQKHSRDNFGLLGFLTWHPDLEITPFMYWLEHGGPYFSFHEIKGKEAGWERLWTCNVSLKKEFLLGNDLFDEDFPSAAWEDVELGYRLGRADLKLLYDNKAIGYHYHPTTIKSIRNKMIANGESVILLKEKLPRNLLPPLGKWPGVAVSLDNLLFPLFFLLEKIAFWMEGRFNLGPVFELVLLHYRIEGLRRKQ